jgi:Probable cobalt transporter subunit (CbtB)
VRRRRRTVRSDGWISPSGRRSAGDLCGTLARHQDRHVEEKMANLSVPTIPTARRREDPPRAWPVPLVWPSAAPSWLLATGLFCLLLYYFVGVDQGALSVFGSDMHIHEFVHDGRHVLAFPCH